MLTIDFRSFHRKMFIGGLHSQTNTGINLSPALCIQGLNFVPPLHGYRSLLGQRIDLLCYFDQPANLKLDHISQMNSAFLLEVIL